MGDSEGRKAVADIQRTDLSQIPLQFIDTLVFNSQFLNTSQSS